MLKFELDIYANNFEFESWYFMAKIATIFL